MPLKLDIVNDKVVITASMKVIKELDAVIVMKNKKLSNQYLLYIYFSASYDEENPFRDLDHKAKDKEALYRAFGVINKTELTAEEDKIIIPARNAFIKYTETAEERIIASYNQKLDELKELLDANKPVIERFDHPATGEVKFSTNAEILTKIMSSIDTLIEKREKIRASLLNQNTSGRVKGGHSSSLIEQGVFKDI